MTEHAIPTGKEPALPPEPTRAPRLGGDRALLHALEVLQPVGRQGRIEVRRLLNSVNDPAAVDSLFDLMVEAANRRSMQAAFTAHYAAQALHRIGGARTLQRALRLITNADYGVRRRAASLLSHWGDESIVDPLLDHMLSMMQQVPRPAHAESVVYFVAQVLGDLGGRRAMERAISLLNAEDAIVRQYAADILGRVGDTSVMEALAGRLTDQAQTVISATARAMGRINREHAVDLVTRAVDSTHDYRMLRYALVATSHHGRLLRRAIVLMGYLPGHEFGAASKLMTNSGAALLAAVLTRGMGFLYTSEEGPALQALAARAAYDLHPALRPTPGDAPHDPEDLRTETLLLWLVDWLNQEHVRFRSTSVRHIIESYRQNPRYRGVIDAAQREADQRRARATGPRPAGLTPGRYPPRRRPTHD